MTQEPFSILVDERDWQGPVSVVYRDWGAGRRRDVAHIRLASTNLGRIHPGGYGGSRPGDALDIPDIPLVGPWEITAHTWGNGASQVSMPES